MWGEFQAADNGEMMIAVSSRSPLIYAPFLFHSFICRILILQLRSLLRHGMGLVTLMHRSEPAEG